MTISELVRRAADLGASDIHLVYGRPPRFRVDGSICEDGGQALTQEDCDSYAKELAGDGFDALKKTGELDSARTIAGVRCRLNIFSQQGHFSAAIRLLHDRIPKLDELGLPAAVMEFPSYNQGIVLITGETGSGKSTTLAAVLDSINHTQPKHILTLEDPIEYVYTPDRCVINQREVGRDTQSFSAGLRAALREDPDVILVGEMRDLDTIETALTAAETGHLVFGTVHTNSAADSIDRIVGVFPAERQQQIRLQLSMTLRAVLSQQLLPKNSGGGRVLACEVMKVDGAIRNLIREGKTPQIQNAIQTSGAAGNILMDRALQTLFASGKISRETYESALRDPSQGKLAGMTGTGRSASGMAGAPGMAGAGRLQNGSGRW